MHRVRRTFLQCAAAAAVGLIAGAADSRAETNQHPIAIPAIGTQGTATPYPSRIVVNSLGGPSHTGTISVTLHGVSHPCIDELAVLLVHNETDKYLLLSNAGGCRELAGTDLRIAPTLGGVLPFGGPAGPAYGSNLVIEASNYGPLPVFPSPAPAGPYTPSRPSSNTSVNGTWDLYIVDTANNNRGVVAAGWSLNYPSTVEVESEHTAVAVPGSGSSGPAQHYPIEFDMTGVSPTSLVDDVVVALAFGHTRPDDLRVVLQSPSGTAVVLMMNAGGGTDVSSNTRISFRDSAPGLVPNAGPIVNNTAYRPGSQYLGGVGLPVPPPGPAGPLESSFAAFADEPIAGTWRLWVSDHFAGETGTIDKVELRITPRVSSLVDIVSPAGIGTIPSTQPFVRVEVATNGVLETANASYRVMNGPALDFYDAGSLTRVPGTGMYVANVPVKYGINDIVVRFRNTTGDTVVSDGVQIGVEEFHYTLAEGATGTFFDLDVTIANPSNTLAGIEMQFLPEGGAPTSIDVPVAINSQHQQRVDNIVPAAAVSTVVRSLAGVPLAVERTMIWDERGYGGHGGTAASPATRWLFAEGSQGFFNTFILLANTGAAESAVTMDFLLEGGGVVTHALAVPPGTRRTIFAGDIPGLVNQSFGVDITATQPILAERAMYLPVYLPGARLFEGGHGAAGVNRAERRWFLAEGATGGFFETFVLIGNPNNTPANVTLTYLLPTGETVTQVVDVAANGRRTINVETVDPKLADTAVSTTLVSDRPIVVERAMYWPDISVGWREAHNSFGLTDAGLRWGVADGRIGGPREFQTYILLANPNPVPAEVEVRFLKASQVEIRHYTLAPTSRLNINPAVDVPELGTGVFSAEVRVLNFQPIAVEKAMYWNDTAGAIWAGGTGVTATLLPPR
jgi:subtilisin-like proprotein convertase family protein